MGRSDPPLDASRGPAPREYEIVPSRSRNSLSFSTLLAFRTEGTTIPQALKTSDYALASRIPQTAIAIER